MSAKPILNQAKAILQSIAGSITSRIDTAISALFARTINSSPKIPITPAVALQAKSLVISSAASADLPSVDAQKLFSAIRMPCNYLREACDTLVIWKTLATLIHDPIEITAGIRCGADAVKRAKDFNNWLDQSKTTLSQITELDLSMKNLSSLPAFLGKMPQLKELDLSGNQLTFLSKDIDQLCYLQRLYLNHNQLLTLRPEIGKLVHLLDLFVGNNKLRSLPPELGQLAELRRLDLSHNQLRTLPPEMEHLTKLQILHVQNNQLTELHPALCRLRELQELLAGDNKLTALPSEIKGLKNLEALKLNSNKIIRLPAEISGLHLLQELDLTRNELTELPSYGLSQLRELKRLYITYNQLTYLPDSLTQLAPSCLIFADGNPFNPLASSVFRTRARQQNGPTLKYDAPPLVLHLPHAAAGA